MRLLHLPKRYAHFTRAFAHRDYRIFYSGQFISLIGTWMQTVAESWLVYRLTGSAALLGLVGFCSQIPIFLLSPLGGAVADRFPRRSILLTTQSVAMTLALTFSALTLTGTIQIWHLFIIASLLGVANAFDIPARQSFLIELVGKKDLFNAIGLNATMFNAARVVGPAIAGVLVATIGEGWCFFANGMSYIAVIIGLYVLRPKEKHGTRKSASVIADIREGITYAFKTPPIRDLLLLVGIVSLTAFPYGVLMPIFADSILHGGPKGLGILLGSAGVGALIGAIRLAARRGIKGISLNISVCGIIFCISLLLFSFSKSFWLSSALLLFIGFASVTQMAATNTLVQAIVPDNFRGRVMSFYSMMFMGSAPIGALISGYLADRLGAPAIVAGGATISLISVAIFGLRLPLFRQSVRPLLTQEMIGGEPPEEVRLSPVTTAKT